jgi:hypothetical protein
MRAPRAPHQRIVPSPIQVPRRSQLASETRPGLGTPTSRRPSAEAALEESATDNSAVVRSLARENAPAAVSSDGYEPTRPKRRWQKSCSRSAAQGKLDRTSGSSSLLVLSPRRLHHKATLRQGEYRFESSHRRCLGCDAPSTDLIHPLGIGASRRQAMWSCTPVFGGSYSSNKGAERSSRTA